MEGLKMKEWMMEKLEKEKFEKEKLEKEKATKGKIYTKRKSHKGKNNPSWLLLFVPVFIKI